MQVQILFSSMTIQSTLNEESKQALALIARQIASPGKGILAADESTGTIQKRFDTISVANTEANRAAYRSLLFKAKSLGNYISGAILYDETLHQKNAMGESMISLLEAQGIIPGIKVDSGLVNLPGTDEEKFTEGLDGLGKRCANYYKAGARFAKWRAALSIDVAKNKPSNIAISAVTQGLAHYARVCQENGLVPIVEPEILSDGPHSIETCAEVMDLPRYDLERVLVAQYKALSDYGVFLEGTLLKPNMVTSGSEYAPKSDPETVGYYTARVLRRGVPAAVPGIMFLSGGQSEEESSLNLNAICKREGSPWVVSFSFGRALQASCLKAWRGRAENETIAQEELLKRANANSLAQLGKYSGGFSGDAASASLFEKKYVY
ncbi:fructose-1,6-bisphosphate aldolase [Cardiosporidium cionae]|uniref:Fructose-bisphosphate aldolase n=1 Tax=Cardiosporidium cionae TaxID=476202 RepID=A0ABQ7J805_9APIC|nr:fructose-1,6-bisphosphate aldolase [Cardiosporidium cionae]|eukprot:KAF8820130.1 fructose-1,6-bisphosphate aldolase [Cardiosporidium cionae]